MRYAVDLYAERFENGAWESVHMWRQRLDGSVYTTSLPFSTQAAPLPLVGVVFPQHAELTPPRKNALQTIVGAPERVSSELAGVLPEYDSVCWCTFEELIQYDWSAPALTREYVSERAAMWVETFGVVPAWAYDEADSERTASVALGVGPVDLWSLDWIEGALSFAERAAASGCVAVFCLRESEAG